jgi:2-polyprenyl-3-methyl-5-hydroxy-6-metoxy-1,4-benzoquinol methylase
MKYKQALQLLESFDSDISRLYQTNIPDYKGKNVDAQAARYYLKMQKYRFAEIASSLPTPFEEENHLLEIGTSYGFLISLLAKDKVWQCEGLDLPENIDAYSFLAKDNGVKIHAGSLGIQNLPFSDSSFDLIIFAEVLEHLPLSPQLVFSELNRVLAKNGHLVLTTPNIARFANIIRLAIGKNILEPFPDIRESENVTAYLEHVREYTMQEVCQLVLENGFTIQKALFSSCWDRHFYSWITNLIPQWRANIMVIAQKH